VRRGNRVTLKAIGTDRPQLWVADAEWISDPVLLFNLKFVGRTRRLGFTNFKLAALSAHRRPSPRGQSERTRSRAGIDDRITRDRARMFAGRVAAGIAVMHVPDIAGDMLLQDHDVA